MIEKIDKIKQDFYALLGDTGVLFVDHANSDTEPYLSESLGRRVGKAFAVVFPKKTEDVSTIVKICSQYKLPIVPQGGNTGRCLGAQSDSERAVIINLQKMNRIRDLDLANMTVTVEAGMILHNLQNYVAEKNVFFPLSMGAEGSCQIGGNLATNAGGTNVLRYGNTRDLTLGIEAVTADGEILDELSGLRKDNTGFDLKNLLIGSEGTLAIITAATFKLFPAEIHCEHGFIALNSVADAVSCLNRLQSRFVGKVSSFEIMPNIAMSFLEKHSDLRCPIESNYPWYVWYKVADGFAGLPQGELQEQNLLFLESLFDDELVVDATVSQNEGMKERFSLVREMIVEVQQHEGALIKFDISVPISRVDTLITEGNKTLEAICPGVRPYPFGHLGDGNIHYNLTRPIHMSDDVFLDKYKEKLVNALHDLVKQLGGSFSAEHGVGSQKIRDMERYKSPVALDLMRRIKSALDPQGLMNPRKIIPPR